MSDTVAEHLIAEVRSAEEELLRIKSKLATLQKNIALKTVNSNPDLVNSNLKLKYRIGILKSSLEEEAKKRKLQEKDNMEILNTQSITKGIQECLTRLFKVAVTTAYPENNSVVPVVPSSRPHFGDYQCNAAMPVANSLKAKGVKIQPIEVASKILENVPPSPIVDRIEIAAPGFLNIWLSKSFCIKEIIKLILDGVQPPSVDRKLNVIVDFSSPNIAKEMHVGHLRSTIIGDSICRFLEFMGHNVMRINHVGDWGTQFGMLIAHLQEEFPNYLVQAPPIEDLQSFYKESKIRFDNDSDFKNKAYSCVVKLQKKDPDMMKAWNLICNVSRREFQSIYDKLGIVIQERGESFYQERMERLVNTLEERNYLQEDEGRKVLFGDEGMIPMTIKKSDGGFTYDTSDLAALQQRIEEEKADWIIYVTDSGQATHFKVLLGCAEKVGIYSHSRTRVDHVMFGVVLGEDKKKFKTRSGETVKLNDLLEEGVRRAEENLKEKNRHLVLTEQELIAAKESVAYGCIKYADLCHNRINDYVFSFDKMLEDRGNTAVYLLYALTRIRSIARTASISNENLQSLALQGTLEITHEKEWKLIKTLLRFNEVLEKIIDDLCLHHLCEFLYEVSTTFSEFYDNCYCIEKDSSGKIVKVNKDRLLLCEATALTIEKCFHILGLKPIARM